GVRFFSAVVEIGIGEAHQAEFRQATARPRPFSGLWVIEGSGGAELCRFPPARITLLAQDGRQGLYLHEHPMQCRASLHGPNIVHDEALRGTVVVDPRLIPQGVLVLTPSLGCIRDTAGETVRRLRNPFARTAAQSEAFHSIVSSH